MGPTGANKKVANSLVALSSAAVLAVYSAGYQRTKAAAERFERLAASRRQAAPAPAVAGTAPGAPVPVASALPAAGATPAAGAAGDGAALGPQPSEPAAPATPRAAPASAGSGAGSLATGAHAAGTIPAATPTDPAVKSDGASAPAVGAAAVPAPAVPLPSSPEPPAVAGPAPADTAPAAPLPRGRFVDGTYQGRGSCIHGDIQAQVIVKNGRIVEATISSCETRYSCDWLDPILPQVTARQSAFVDSVSGATDSTDAFSAAVTDALLKAQ